MTRLPSIARITGTGITGAGNEVARIAIAGIAIAGPGAMADRPDEDDRNDDDGGNSDVGLATKTRTKTAKPPLYKVMLLNDDYTPMEFVVMVLEKFFGITHGHAVEIMLTVHKKGLAVVGVFSHEIAETKVAQVMDFARRHQHPLQCTMEKED